MKSPIKTSLKWGAFILVVLTFWFFNSPKFVIHPPKTCGYIFRITTGEAQSIRVDGKEIYIRFDPGSDPDALKTIGSLAQRILSANGDGKHIFITGLLDRKIRRTSTEEYQDFRLQRWHILTPFLEGYSGFTDEKPEPGFRRGPGGFGFIRERTSLEAKDFDADVKGIDLSRFQRSSI